MVPCCRWFSVIFWSGPDHAAPERGEGTGTLEVLLTAPLDEFFGRHEQVLGALAFTWCCWLAVGGSTWYILRVEAQVPFDYRPLLSFQGAAMICSGARSCSVGMFFSSLNRNQIVAPC